MTYEMPLGGGIHRISSARLDFGKAPADSPHRRARQKRSCPVSTEIATSLEQRVVALMNAERSAAGLPNLKIEVHLNASAQAHSDWMAETGSLSHEGADGSDVADRVEGAGFPLKGSWGATENLAYAGTTGDLDEGELETMHSGLMNSAGHRANILDPDVAYVGVGLSVGQVAAGGDSQEAVFLTQNFADTDGQVLVQEEVEGDTVLQSYLDGAPVGDPQIVEPPPQDEDTDDPDRDREDQSDSGGGGCFVATAAYGDRLHPDVVDLRRFRDKVLVRHRAGHALIGAYRVVGPRMACIVSHDRASGRAARALIGPLARLAGDWMRRR